MLHKRKLNRTSAASKAISDARERRRQVVKDYLSLFGIVLGGIWAIWTFAWEQKIKPQYFEEPVLKITLTAKRALENGEKSSLGAIPVQVTGVLENTSKRRLYLTATHLLFSGWKYQQGAESMPIPEVARQLQGSEDRFWDKFNTPTVQLAHASSVLAGGWSLAPGESVTFSDIAWIPEGVFNQVEIDANVTAFDSSAYCSTFHLVESSKGRSPSEDIFVGEKDDHGACLATVGVVSADERIRRHAFTYVQRAFLVLPSPESGGLKSSERTPARESTTH